MFLVVDHAELSRRNALYQFFGVNDELSLASAFEHSRMIFGRMANLETHTCRCSKLSPRVERKEVEIVYGEVLLVCGARLVALAHIQRVVSNILLYHVPRTATEAESVTLSDGVEPQTAVLANELARFQFEHFARLLAEELANIVVVVYLTEETDALRVLALGQSYICARKSV